MFGDERALQLACVRAYNEWQLGVLRRRRRAPLRPRRSFPATGIADAVAELEWALAQGYRGVLDLDVPERRRRAVGATTIRSGRAPKRPEIAGRAPHRQLPRRRSGRSARRFEPDAVLPRAATSKSGANTGAARRAPDLLRGSSSAFPRLRVAARRSRTSAGSRRCSSRPTTCSSATAGSPHDGGDAADACRVAALPPELLGDVHGRHGRHRAPPSPEPRSSHVVDRLSAHGHRLAEQPRDDRARSSAACRPTRCTRCCTTTARRLYRLDDVRIGCPRDARSQGRRRARDRAAGRASAARSRSGSRARARRSRWRDGGATVSTRPSRWSRQRAAARRPSHATSRTPSQVRTSSRRSPARSAASTSS